METGKWSPFKESLKRKIDSLHKMVPAIGFAYATLLAAYSDPMGGGSGYKDRGYGVAKKLLGFLSAKSEDKDKDKESGYFVDLYNLNLALVPGMPGADINLRIMTRIREERLNPSIKIVDEIEERGKQGEKKMFKPREFVEVAYNINLIRDFFDVEAGLTHLAVEYFCNKVPVEVTTAKFIPSLDAFGHKWGSFLRLLNSGSSYYPYGYWEMGEGYPAVDQYGFIVANIYDSYGTVIPHAVESDDPGEVLRTEVPEAGYNALFFKFPREDELKTEIRERDLIGDSQRDTMCIPSFVRRKGDRGKFLKQLRRIKKNERIREKLEEKKRLEEEEIRKKLGIS